MSEVLGNLEGLRRETRQALERTLRRNMRSDEVVTSELANHLASISADCGRRVGVLVNRRGHIVQVVVGDAHRIYLPDLGRDRAGSGLRGVRYIHTAFRDQELIDRDDLADLRKLRLDIVGSIRVRADGFADGFACAYLQPTATEMTAYEIKHYAQVSDCELDLTQLITDIELLLARVAPKTRKADGVGERALAVGVYSDRASMVHRMAELQELASTAGVEVAEVITQLRPRLDNRYVVGKGKLEEIILRCVDLDIGLVIFDHNLTPAQGRAIANLSELRVIDRTQLILDIFAQHATSRDGKLQVELAQLRYSLPRLTDLDAGLSRLTGGIGGRGPGETKLEINRRRARDRITRLDRDINQLSERRDLLRRKRRSREVPVVAIVGYTNAGKSTLLNSLTTSDVLAADKLFATLDPITRRLRFPNEREAVLIDTVGFIRDLPADLMRAFRATLEELETADILLHLVDASDPDKVGKRKVVDDVLKELGLEAVPQILVYNKADQIEPVMAAAMARRDGAMCISALKGEGLEELVACVVRMLWGESGLALRDASAQLAEERQDASVFNAIDEVND